jgi:hypothetical protein
MSDPATARRLLRRSKDAERRVAKWMMEHDGPDPAFMPGNGVVTSTGRVGHVNALQYDVHSLHYSSEVKNVLLNKTMLEWWVKILSKAVDQRKEACLVISPSNKPGTFTHNGFRVSLPDWHVITPERHAWLLECERKVNGG